ncbi:spidroin-2-like [Harpia harpyja]|uniref:spidroin-2-like n=1 Tax=Harpia harpyja TaxID=202280 RepID=UPI0022B1673A|nr:spidroin-2-like [Harpia harpyja]
MVRKTVAKKAGVRMAVVSVAVARKAVERIAMVRKAQRANPPPRPGPARQGLTATSLGTERGGESAPGGGAALACAGRSGEESGEEERGGAGSGSGRGSGGGAGPVGPGRAAAAERGAEGRGGTVSTAGPPRPGPGKALEGPRVPVRAALGRRCVGPELSGSRPSGPSLTLPPPPNGYRWLRGSGPGRWNRFVAGLL